MRKFLFVLLAIIGVGLVSYSIMQFWMSWTQSTELGQGIAMGVGKGYQYWQGIAAGILALIAFLLVFKKPKLAVLPGLAASGLALWLYLTPPLDLFNNPLDPQKAIFLAIAGGILLALAGLIAPKKA